MKGIAAKSNGPSAPARPAAGSGTQHTARPAAPHPHHDRPTRTAARLRPRRLAARLCTLLCLLLAAGCDRASTLSLGEVPEGSLHSIRALKQRCTSAAGHVVAEPLAVRGVVTANDRYGEFPHEIVIEDDTGGLRIALDRARLADLFPLGSTVTVQCDGLALGLYGGRVVLGSAPDARYGVARIPADRISRHLRCEGHAGMPEVGPVTPDAIRTPERIDTYVRLDGLRFTESAAWCDLDPATLRPVATERTAVDAAGRRLTVRTSASCLYAEEPLPAGPVTLCGIVDCFNGSYSLRITARRILTP